MSDRGQGVESQIKELKVSGHTMSLEPGLYCVYNAPGGPSSNEAGLPGVRISAAPGAKPGQITVSTFTTDGWIGADSAALVHVSSARAELMVTVYQAKDSTADAPNLQVVLLSAAGAKQPAAKPQAPQAPAPQASAPQASALQAPAPQLQAPAGEVAPANIEVVAHVYGVGDIAGRLGEWMSEPGSQRWIEGFGIAAPAGIAASDIEYQAVLGRGWLSPWSQGGQYCGSRGMSLPILGLRVRLRGDAANSRRVVLSASFVDGTQVGPVGDGEPCEAPSLAALEAFKLALEPVRAEKTAGRVAESSPAAKSSRRATPPTPEAPAARKPKPAAAKVGAATAKAEPPTPAKPAPGKPGRAKPKQAAAATEPTKSAPAKSGPGKAAAKPAARGVKRTPPTTRRR